jgi:hypothetical protein
MDDSRGLQHGLVFGFSCVCVSGATEDGFSTMGHGNEIMADSESTALFPIVIKLLAFVWGILFISCYRLCFGAVNPLIFAGQQQGVDGDL